MFKGYVNVYQRITPNQSVTESPKNTQMTIGWPCIAAWICFLFINLAWVLGICRRLFREVFWCFWAGGNGQFHSDGLEKYHDLQQMLNILASSLGDVGMLANAVPSAQQILKVRNQTLAHLS